MQTKLKVTLIDGKKVEIKRCGYAVKVWNDGKWNNIAAFEPEDYEEAKKCYINAKKDGWRYVEICQLF